MRMKEWQSSADPLAMIRWLERQGYGDALWDFTIGCCRRIWDELPGDSFRRVVTHFEQIGSHDIDEVLHEASRSLERLERRFSKSDDEHEQTQLSRGIGLGRMVFAFEAQHGAAAARSISSDMVDWADDAGLEFERQANLLREIVSDPSQPFDGYSPES